jgi:hypothetical protein
VFSSGIRFGVFTLVACVVCAGLILVEFGSFSSHRPSPRTRLPATEIEPAPPEVRKLADPLSTSTQRRAETQSSANDPDSPLRGARLAGIVIGRDLRIAIFAVTGTGSRMLSEGEALEGWRLASISPDGVVLSGPAGSMVLKPQPEADLVRPPPPLGVQSGQPGAAMAGAPAQPIAGAPLAIGSLPPAIPVQTLGYPYYFSDFYPAYDPYYPWDWDWGNPWGWGWPVGVSVGFGECWNCAFRGRFFRPGFRGIGFGHAGSFHPGLGRVGFAHASFGGGFRSGGGRR